MGVRRNFLDSMLLKLCELSLPSVNFSGSHDGLILRNSLQKKNSQQHVVLYTGMIELYTGILNSWFLLSETCR